MRSAVLTDRIVLDRNGSQHRGIRGRVGATLETDPDATPLDMRYLHLDPGISGVKEHFRAVAEVINGNRRRFEIVLAVVVGDFDPR